MPRKRIWVSPDESKWKVKTEGAKRASNIFDNKDDAVKRAIELAKGGKPSQVVIQKRDGKIQEERTYGDDPYPPEG
jgi:hypothetical protein